MAEPVRNERKSMMNLDYGDQRISKFNELNSNMTISNQSADEYDKKIRDLGGNVTNG